MENQKKEKEEVDKQIKDEIEKIVSPIFKKALKEMPNTQMSVGSGLDSEQQKPKVSLWQPHNLRRYYLFSKINFKPNKPAPSPNQPSISYGDNEVFIYLPFNWNYEHKIVNYGSEHHYYNFMQCNIKVKKNQIEITNKAVGKQWFQIERSSFEEIDKRIDELQAEMEAHCTRVLKAFIELHGGSSDFGIIKRISENKIKGDDFIDKIPARMTIHDTIFKKVYLEKNIEYPNEATVKQHIKNVALNDFAPIITQELAKGNTLMEQLIGINKTTAENLQKSAEASKFMSENLNTHIPYFQSLIKSTESQTESAKALSQEVTKMTRILGKIEKHTIPPKKPKKQPRTRKYGLLDEEMDKIKNMEL